MFEKWYNISYHYFTYFKLEASDVWKTGVWFLKLVEERTEENHIYHLRKTNSVVKARAVYRGCNVCYQDFSGKWKN